MCGERGAEPWTHVLLIDLLRIRTLKHERVQVEAFPLVYGIQALSLLLPCLLGIEAVPVLPITSTFLGGLVPSGVLPAGLSEFQPDIPARNPGLLQSLIRREEAQRAWFVPYR